jgi:hypothetical protein
MADNGNKYYEGILVGTHLTTEAQLIANVERVKAFGPENIHSVVSRPDGTIAINCGRDDE